MEQTRRAAAQRGRDQGAPHLHRSAFWPNPVHCGARMPCAFGLGKRDAYAFNHEAEGRSARRKAATNGQRQAYAPIGSVTPLIRACAAIVWHTRIVFNVSRKGDE